ncbi:hypothetical protein [Mesorhizobium abyssinicae]|uniref:hypothetical protein n=1 Tax=Mesorhizobium abyssinicae TaxID=1209958 RepID=UPI003CEEECAF
MKLLPAKYIIEQALARGTLTRGMKVLETGESFDTVRSICRGRFQQVIAIP